MLKEFDSLPAETKKLFEECKAKVAAEQTKIEALQAQILELKNKPGADAAADGGEAVAGSSPSKLRQEVAAAAAENAAAPAAEPAAAAEPEKKE